MAVHRIIDQFNDDDDHELERKIASSAATKKVLRGSLHLLPRGGRHVVGDARQTKDLSQS